MNTAHQEGVIKFQLRFTPAAPQPFDRLREINAWRKILYLTQLIGQQPGRYQGYGYGNLSQRMAPFEAPPTERAFIISGTQTGGLADLTEAHYATVLACQPSQNLLVATGPIKPSSESLTHGMIYALDDQVRWVMHVHSPATWRQAAALDIPTTRSAVPYGSPEMAEEVARLFRETPVAERHLLAMGGHEDGLVSFGRTAAEAGTVLLTTLAQALQLA